MKHSFYKYQGTGNDFILMDNRYNTFDKNNANFIARLCDRRFGIGADGLILLEDHDELDFEMVYFNSDGNTSSMCGNGGRCIVSFAKFLGLIGRETQFKAIDGVHQAKITKDDIVELQMSDVDKVKDFGSYIFLDTGSPHHVEMVEELHTLDVKELGAKIRYGELYDKDGSNVNFVQKIDDIFMVRTYERGVESETLSCGTGVTAVAIAMDHTGQSKGNETKLFTQGGELKVRFSRSSKGYKDIWLIGPAAQVYNGEISW